MTSNALAIRRILRSIGSRASPSLLSEPIPVRLSARRFTQSTKLLQTQSLVALEDEHRRPSSQLTEAELHLDASPNKTRDEAVCSSSDTSVHHVARISQAIASEQNDHSGLRRSWNADVVDHGMLVEDDRNLEGSADHTDKAKQEKEAFPPTEDTMRWDRAENIEKTGQQEQKSFLDMISRIARIRSQDDQESRVKSAEELPAKYYGAQQGTRRSRLIRQLAAWNKQDLRQDSAALQNWRGAFRMLQEYSEQGTDRHGKRMETIRLPEGIKAIWTVNLGEAVLEIMQRTGSHIQMWSNVDTAGRFSSLTLFGTAEQNTAALDFLRQSSITRAVSESDMSISGKLADYALKMEITNRIGATSKVDVDADDLSMDWLDAACSGELDESGQARLQDALDEVINGQSSSLVDQKDAEVILSGKSQELQAQQGTPIARPVWTSSPFKKVAPKLPHVDDTSSGPDAFWSLDPSGVPFTPTTLTAHLEDIITGKPRMSKGTSKSTNPPHSGPRRALPASIGKACVALLIEPANLPKVTTSAMNLAFTYLAKGRSFPSIRRILVAHESAKQRITTDSLNVLLSATAPVGDIYNLSFLLHVMTRRRKKPNGKTWLIFYDLTLRRFPHMAQLVKSRMQTIGILENKSTLLDCIDLDITHEFAKYLDQDGDVQKYILSKNMRHPGLRWLTPESANRMIKILAERGKFAEALLVVDNMRLHRRQPDSATLNTLIMAAGGKQARDHATVVAILRKLTAGDLPIEDAMQRARSAVPDGPYAETSQDHLGLNIPALASLSGHGASQDLRAPSFEEPLQSVTGHDVGLDTKSYSTLFDLGWHTGSWNFLRVVWRYACCDRKVSLKMRKKVNESLSQTSLESSPNSQDLLDPGKFFKAGAGQFVLGVARGFGKEDIVDVAGLEELAISTGKAGLPSPRKNGQLGRFHRSAMRRRIYSDFDAGQSMRPTLPLAVMLERAWRKDRAWHKAGLGVSSVSDQGRVRREVYSWMDLLGIEVPVHNKPAKEISAK